MKLFAVFLATLLLGTFKVTEPHVQPPPLEQLANLYPPLNAQINLVSRTPPPTPSTILRDHILPSTSLLPLIPPNARTLIDVGSGGGFPGLPLSICRPDLSVTLLDARSKKLRAVSSLFSPLGVSNCETVHARSEEHVGPTYDVVTGRSVTALPRFASWIHHLMHPDSVLIYIKGGELDTSIQPREVSGGGGGGTRAVSKPKCLRRTRQR